MGGQHEGELVGNSVGECDLGDAAEDCGGGGVHQVESAGVIGFLEGVLGCEAVLGGPLEG